MYKKHIDEIIQETHRILNYHSEKSGWGALCKNLINYDTLLDDLIPREREILKYRYGLNGGGMQTLENTGKNWGITRERVRHIEAQAINKLQKKLFGPPKIKIELEDAFDKETLQVLEKLNNK